MSDFLAHLRRTLRWPFGVRPDDPDIDVGVDALSILDDDHVIDPTAAPGSSSADRPLTGPIAIPPRGIPRIEITGASPTENAASSVVCDDEGHIIRLHPSEAKRIARAHTEERRRKIRERRRSGSGRSASSSGSRTPASSPGSRTPPSVGGTPQSAQFSIDFSDISGLTPEGEPPLHPPSDSIPEKTPFLEQYTEEDLRTNQQQMYNRKPITLGQCRKLMREIGIDFELQDLRKVGGVSSSQYGGVCLGKFKRQAAKGPPREVTVPVVIKLGVDGDAVEGDPVGDTVKEILLGDAINHAHVVNILCGFGPTFVTALRMDKREVFQAAFMVMEYLSGGTIATFFDEVMSSSLYISGKEPVPQPIMVPFGLSLAWARQIACGLAYLHSGGIAHQAVTLVNVVLDKYGTAKLTDLCSAVLVKPVGKRDPQTGALPPMTNYQGEALDYTGAYTFEVSLNEEKMEEQPDGSYGKKVNVPAEVYARDFHQYRQILTVFAGFRVRHVNRYIDEFKIHPEGIDFGFLNIASMCSYQKDKKPPLKYSMYDVVKHPLFSIDPLMEYIQDIRKSSFHL